MERQEMAKSTDTRTKIALWIIVASFLGILIVSIIMLYVAKKYELVFNALIPLFATWVGTVLAYYFGRENLEAANRQMDKVIDKLTPEKLESITVRQLMIDLETMFVFMYEKEEDLNITIENLKKEFFKKQRLPIINKNGLANLIIHKSSIDAYLTQISQNQNGAPADPPTLKMFLDAHPNKFGFKEEKGFAIVAKTSSLGNAKDAMEKIPGSRDVFITENGEQNGRLIGWLTDNKITEFLKV